MGMVGLCPTWFEAGMGSGWSLSPSPWPKSMTMTCATTAGPAHQQRLRGLCPFLCECGGATHCRHHA